MDIEPGRRDARHFWLDAGFFLHAEGKMNTRRKVSEQSNR
ncbi:hypothetical protein K788_0008595 [Paraburkholderia caribensis MBA4]|uniref:Uncharacterized protein n=1 Tax=Paraburkholderia caribensis MBA4 TaxID=1323664 RepID=A0A0N7JUP4_9BURK|nr:hypothetical protein K788_0008595 [Paraburkholderia caribensis MBA4]